MRAIVPSSFMISQITPAGRRPARRARSTEPSVCPARRSTPPSRARSGKMWPGRTRSVGRASSRIAVRIVCARSAAEMPVVTPSRASIEIVKAVPRGAEFSASGTIISRCSRRSWSGSMGRQISPRPYFAMKLIASGVTFSAAMQRSPSFSRSSSSTRTTMRPARISAIASGIEAITSLAS